MKNPDMKNPDYEGKIKVGQGHMTVLDGTINAEVEQFLEDRAAGLSWLESELRKDPKNKLGPRPKIDAKPRECTECDMTGKFYVDDYICVDCRDKSDLSLLLEAA